MEAHGFRRTARQRIVLRADDVERGLLTELVRQLVTLVTPDGDPFGAETDPLAAMVGIDPFAERPDDPALHRLFPDAYTDDEEAAGEFRRFTERSLRDTKLANARTVLDTLERSGSKIVVSDGEAAAWLGTLNDLRLTLASRIGLDEDNHEVFYALPESDPAFALFHIYDWFTFLQETLVTALTGLRSEPLAADAD
jgi:hypothetical protein